MKSKNNKDDLTITIWHYIKDQWEGEGEIQTISYDEYGADLTTYMGTKWRIDYNENPDEKVMLITIMEDLGEYDKRYLN